MTFWFFSCSLDLDNGENVVQNCIENGKQNTEIFQGNADISNRLKRALQRKMFVLEPTKRETFLLPPLSFDWEELFLAEEHFHSSESEFLNSKN